MIPEFAKRIIEFQSKRIIDSQEFTLLCSILSFCSQTKSTNFQKYFILFYFNYYHFYFNTI